MLVVVGGQSRNIGKTAVVAGLIRTLTEFRWTAVKITQHGHGACAHGGAECWCAAEAGSAFALSEEYKPNKTDSGRYLASGAERSFWLRAPAGELPRAAATLKKILKAGEHTIVESTSLLELVQPDVFLMVLDFGCADFKASGLRFMDRADAFVVIDRGINVPLWEDLARGVWDTKPRFAVRPPRYVTAALSEFVKSKLSSPVR